MNDVLVFLIMLGVIVAVFGTAAIAGLLAAPWLPVRQKELSALFASIHIPEGAAFYDLGCGDGRIMMEAVRAFNVRARGFELSLLPYLACRLRLLAFPKRERIQVSFRNFFSVSLRDADVVFCFLTPKAMEKLKAKFVNELKPGALVISYAFQVPGWKIIQEIRPFAKSIPVFLYRHGEA